MMSGIAGPFSWFFPSLSPSATNQPLKGYLIEDPSISPFEPVDITAPLVGTPTTFPLPSVLIACENISALLYEF